MIWHNGSPSQNHVYILDHCASCDHFEVESNPMVRAVIRAKLAPNDTALPVTVGSCLDALTTVLRQSTTHDVRCKMSFLCHFSFLFAFAYH